MMFAHFRKAPQSNLRLDIKCQQRRTFSSEQSGKSNVNRSGQYPRHLQFHPPEWLTYMPYWPSKFKKSWVG